MKTLALGLDRTLIELRQFCRETGALFFSFAFPLMMLALFATIFGSQFKGSPDMNAGRFFLPGLIASGIILTSFQTIAMGIAAERDDGTLKRLHGTPLPPAAYFLGKIGLVAVMSLANLAAMLLLARVAYSVALPTTSHAWFTLAWVFVLGVTTGTVLGIAYSSLVPSAKAGTPMVVAPLMLLQFTSGVYFAFRDIPVWIKQVASLFPLKWIAQGLRSVFFPAAMASEEMAKSWELGRTALVLGAWAIFGLAACLITFRWLKKGSA